MTVEVRVATIEDAEQIQQIYAPYVENSAITFEYLAPDVDEIRRRMIEKMRKYPWIVAVEDGLVVGYAYAGTFKARAAYDWSVETSIYVRRDIRTRGIGRALYTELERILKLMGITNLNACVAYTEKDTPWLTQGSVRFHEKLGFRQVGIFKQCAYKFDRWWDMCWFEKHINEHAAGTPAVIPFSELEL